MAAPHQETTRAQEEVVLLDIAYTAYFNSLYSEATTYVFLLLAFGALLNLVAADRPSYMMLGVFVVSSGLFVAAKNQNLPVALLLAVFAARLAWVYHDERWRAAGLLSAVAILSVAIWLYRDTPSWFEQVNTYDSVFTGAIYKESRSEAAHDLTDLGVDPSYAYLAGQSYFTAPSKQVAQQPDFTTSFYGHVTRTKLIEFYVTHPQRFLDGMQESATAATTMRPTYIGNLQRSSGAVPRAKSDRISIWSTLKARYFPQSLWALVVFYLAYFAGVVWKRGTAKSSSAKLVAEFCGLVDLMACVAFPVAFVGEGTYELVKHLFTFDILFDLTLVIAVTAVVAQLFQLATQATRARNDRIHDPITAPVSASSVSASSVSASSVSASSVSASSVSASSATPHATHPAVEAVERVELIRAVDPADEDGDRMP